MKMPKTFFGAHFGGGRNCGWVRLMSFSFQVSSLQQQHGKQLLACLDKLERAVYNAAVRCTRNDALADRAVTQMELQLMSLREERDWLKQQNYRVEAQQLENEAQWSENWNKIQTMERELMERNAENRDLEVSVTRRGGERGHSGT
jgi:hypothetical protein